MATYLRQRQGCYYLRLRIPAALSPFFPEKEILKSLNTRDRRTARLTSSRLASEILEVFTLMRHGFISADQAKEKTSALLRREKPKAPRRKHNEPVVKASPPLKQMIEQYMKDNQSAWAPKTLMDYQGHSRLLLDILGNVGVNTIDRDTVRKLRDTLSILPPNLYKRFPDMTIPEIMAKKGCTPMNSTTINKVLTFLGSIMRHCVKEGHISINPVEGLKVQQKKRADEERKAYDRGDILRIVQHLPAPSDRPERYWVPLIGMYTGMRLDEICSLYAEDVKEIDGVLCFDVNAKQDKKLKTVTSDRVLPIHPELVRLGFLGYLEKVKRAGMPRLWMNLNWREADGYSNAMGKWFQKFNRKHVTSDPLKTFHSFRHLVADTLKQQGEQEAVISEVMGHANGSITTGRYGKRYKVQVLLEVISKMQPLYDGKMGSRSGSNQRPPD